MMYTLGDVKRTPEDFAYCKECDLIISKVEKCPICGCTTVDDKGTIVSVVNERIEWFIGDGCDADVVEDIVL